MIGRVMSDATSSLLKLGSCLSSCQFYCLISRRTILPVQSHCSCAHPKISSSRSAVGRGKQRSALESLSLYFHHIVIKRNKSQVVVLCVCLFTLPIFKIFPNSATLSVCSARLSASLHSYTSWEMQKMLQRQFMKCSLSGGFAGIHPPD